MRGEDRPEFRDILAGMSEIFGKEISRIGMRFYFEALSEFPIEDVRRAAGEAIRTLKFFPRPVELIELIRGSDRQYAAEAWRLVCEHVRSGRWRRDTTGNQELEQAVRLMGGWSRLGGMLESEIPFREKEFIEKFEIVRSSPPALKQGDVLGQLGFKPKLIDGPGPRKVAK